MSVRKTKAFYFHKHDVIFIRRFVGGISTFFRDLSSIVIVLRKGVKLILITSGIKKEIKVVFATFGIKQEVEKLEEIRRMQNGANMNGILKLM